MSEIYHHRGCRIVIATGTAAGGGTFMRYEITPESDEAKAAFKRQGVDLISGAKMSDLALGASRKEIDQLLGG
ncbi:hypothetical protein [Dongia mobilis]|jgi:hypothetical protein|uniref:hypothetical protein n=1 Tax=Dongia sp. TaxID=1977262 RepID=UPI0026EFEDAE